MGLFLSDMKDSRRHRYSDRELISRYLFYVHPFNRTILLISIFILISTIIEIINPVLVGFTSDELIQRSPKIWAVIISGVGYLILSTLNWILFSLRRKEMGKFVPFFLENLRMDIFNKIQEQDMSFFDQQLSGKLNTIVSNDTLDFSDTAFLFAETLGNFLISICIFGILLWLNWKLAMIALIALPFLFLLMYALRSMAKQVSRQYRKSIENINAAMVESIEGIQVCKSFGQESNISNQFEKTNTEYLQSLFRLTAVTHMWRPMLDTISSFALAVILYFGAQSVIQNQTSPGTILMFLLFLQKFFRPIMVLSTFFPQLNTGMAAFERILEVIDSKPNVKQNLNPKMVEQIEGEIHFEDVDFQYREGEWIFQGLNLIIPKGEKLAIVGHTGAGKTSLVSLLARYYEFQHGLITIDGIDIRDFTLDSLRKQIGKVEQDIYLFSGTIEENIRYGRQEASAIELHQAIETVHADEFIDRLPMGVKTQVGERGKELSVGQRQLISFARAILTNPKILILDEATSSVDAYTEAMIQEALEKLLLNRTCIIIAHRLSTIINADRIIVMDHGKIIEEGTHVSLLQQGGKYAQLYRQYFEHQSLQWHSIHEKHE